MSYTIYFSVTRFNSESSAYMSSQGKEGYFIRKQNSGPDENINNVYQSETSIHHHNHGNL